MGWTSQYRPKGTSNRDFFSQMLNPHHHIVACATVRGTFYAAVKDETDNSVTALIILTQWSPRSDFNFSYKDMSETMGPFECAAPASVLDALTETTSESALAWRKQCRDALAAKKAEPRVAPGSTIEFAQTLRFTNGDELDTLTFVTRNTFRNPATGRQYSISNWRRRAYRVVGAE